MILVKTSHDGRVETWWINRPEVRNAISLEMWTSLGDHAERVAELPRVRAIVIRGTGPHFSSGADITGLGRSLAADHDKTNYRVQNARAESNLTALAIPLIAAISGYCLGGGLQLALSCDLRIASRESQFSVPPSKLGISYPAQALARLVSIVGIGHASELLMLGNSIDATRAVQMGLVTRVVDDLGVGVQEMVNILVSRSSFTQAATKRLLRTLSEKGAIDAVGRELETESLLHGDLDEGLAAFRDKRPANFGDRSVN